MKNKIFLLVFCVLFISASLYAEWCEIQKLLASDGTSSDHFGYSVAISGDYLIIGAWHDDDAGSSSGSAYIFFKEDTTWVEQAKLTASDAASNDYFGGYVDISGDCAIVGARDNDSAANNAGSAYIFFRNDTVWTEIKKLTASDAAANDRFGYSVSIDGEYAIVSAALDDYSKGSAYIFKQDLGGVNNWGELRKLTDSAGTPNSFFGMSCSISGNYAVVGSNQYYSGTGVACVYYANKGGIDNWGEQQRLSASDANFDDWFGKSVSIDGNYICIGAYGDDDGGNLSGSAYIFSRNDTVWTEIKKLTASDMNSGDFFGWGVSNTEEYAIIGAYKSSDFGSCSGSSYIYYKDLGGSDNWGEQAKITASDAAQADWFGISVGISGDNALVGSVYDDDLGNTSGSAYIFSSASIDIPQNVNISISGTDVLITWDPVPAATSYSIYSSTNPYEQADNWTLVESGITDTTWTEAASVEKKFYFIKAVN